MKLGTALTGVCIDTHAKSKELIDQLPTDHMETFTLPPKTVKFNIPSNNDRWIIIDNTYQEQIQERFRLLQLYPEHLIASTEGKDVQKVNLELKNHVIEYLMDTYPNYFSLHGKHITSHLSGLSIKATGKGKAEDLTATALLVTEDMPIMHPTEKNEDKSDSIYRLNSGTLLFGYHWSLVSQFNEKPPVKQDHPRLWNQWNERKQSSETSARLGMTSRAIHDHIAEYATKHADGVEKYLNSVKPDQLHCRSNWSIETSTKLCQHPDIAEDHNEGLEPNAENLYLSGYIRAERQSFKKLPKSNAVVFGIKTYNWKLSDIFNSPKAFEALDIAEQNLSPEMREYKMNTAEELRKLINMHKMG